MYSNTTAGEEPYQTWCNRGGGGGCVFLFSSLALLSSSLYIYIRLAHRSPPNYILHSHMKEYEMPLISQMISKTVINLPIT